MRTIIALVALVFAGAVGSTASAQTLPTADQIHDRAAAAVGKASENYRETIESHGSLGTISTTTYYLGKDWRRVFTRNGLRAESGVFHGEAWRQSNNGLTVIDEAAPGNERDEQTRSMVRRITAPLDAYVVETLNVRRNGTRRYYDPVTYRLLRTDAIEPTGTTVTTNEAFAPFGSQTLPQTWTVVSAESKLEQHYTRTARADGAVVEADVNEPGSQRVLVEFPPGVHDVTLPTKFVRNAIAVRLTIGTRSVDFELDSGSSSIFMDADLARELGLTLVNSQSVVTAQRYTASQALIPEMKIGGLSMHNVVVGVGPMPGTHPPGVQPLGLLGFDFLAQLGVTIDYQHETVHVVPAADFVPPAEKGTAEIDVRLGFQVPTASVTLDKATAEHMMFDTGWSGQLGFFDYFARRYPEAFHDDLGAAAGYGVGGRFDAEFFHFSSVKLGPITFRDFTGMRMPASSYDYTIDGVVGADMLALFTVNLDYTNGRIFLTPNSFGRSQSGRR